MNSYKDLFTQSFSLNRHQKWYFVVTEFENFTSLSDENQVDGLPPVLNMNSRGTHRLDLWLKPCTMDKLSARVCDIDLTLLDDVNVTWLEQNQCNLSELELSKWHIHAKEAWQELAESVYDSCEIILSKNCLWSKVDASDEHSNKIRCWSSSELRTKFKAAQDQARCQMT